MKIQQVIGREIFDSRGNPALECEIVLENNVRVYGSVPTGISKGTQEAFELRDETTRLRGMGLTKAIEIIENILAPTLVNKEPELVDMDCMLLEIDGTENKSSLGANTMLAISTAVLKAQAVVNELEPYELIAQLFDTDSVSLPFPMYNIIEGGSHADNTLSLQELLIIPVGFKSFRSSMEAVSNVYEQMRILLKKAKLQPIIGIEGGFAADFEDEYQAIDMVIEAISKAKLAADESFVFGLDVAASQLYNPKSKKYSWNGKNLSAKGLIEIYKNLTEQYPIYSIEDGLDEADLDGWKLMMDELGNTIHVVGDDLFVTNPYKIAQGITDGLANATIIKPNQIGTITETLQAIKLCKANDINMIVSHRSCETNDTTIVDLAVGTSTGHIKAGGLNHGERLAKYNRLLRIEDTLMLELLYSE